MTGVQTCALPISTFSFLAASAFALAFSLAEKFFTFLSILGLPSTTSALPKGGGESSVSDMVSVRGFRDLEIKIEELKQHNCSTLINKQPQAQLPV